MPKDITHWFVADKIFEKINDVQMKEIIKKYKNVYLLGAVSFDMPFYCLGQEAKVITSIGSRLHEPSTRNTMDSIKNILNGFEGQVPQYAIAFILGAITHIVVDGAYHPFVYYNCGNNFDKDERKSKIAIFNHREFETKLDLFYKKRYKLGNMYCANQMYINKEICENDFNELLTFEYLLDEDMTKKILNSYLKFQTILNSKFEYWRYVVLNRIKKGEFSSILPVFYAYKPNGRYVFNDKKYEYKNPVTGEVFNETIAEIEEKSIKKALNIFQKLYGLKSKETFLRTVSNIKTPSLETGTMKGMSTDMKYFGVEL